MNADAFRHLYDYHFGVNRWIWDSFAAELPQEQFTQNMGYSHASVRDQFVHILNTDEAWFSELRGVLPAEESPVERSDDREAIRTHWDVVEQMMRDYLSQLRDDQLFDQPIEEPEEDRELMVWQVLVHVVNHGTDHRAQLLRFLHDLGVDTPGQDYIFYAYRYPFR